jgi:hypothetical protein
MKQKRAFFGALAAVGLAASGATALAGSATFDFGTDPATIPGFIFNGNNDQPWQPSGGNPGGFLAVTYPEGGQFGIVLFPDIDAGKLVKAFKFEADLRVGNSTGDRAADGFSVSFARGNDPILADPTTQGVFAGGIAEGGSTTGIAVSFDTWSGNTLPDGPDIEGIIVRVDNVTINRTALPTRHGACNDNTSLQTGPRDAAYWAAGGDPRAPESWAGLCWQPLTIDLAEDGKLTVIWKGRRILDAFQTTYFPSVGRLVLAGRTGGANEHTHFDNIRITTVLADSPIVGLPAGNACGFSIPIADAGPVIPQQNTITMTLNGTAVTPSISKQGDVTTLTINQPAGTSFPSGSTNVVVVSFTDSNNRQSTATRNFITPAYTTIPAEMATTSFTASSSGFLVRVHQLEFGRGPGDANSIVNAEQQLVAGGGYLTSAGEAAPNVAFPSGTANGLYEVAVVNWEQNGGAAGNFSASSDPAIPDEFIPGIPGQTDSTDNIAAEILTFLELPQGCLTLGVNSDDGFTVRLGHSPRGTLLGSFNGGRGSADTTFRIYVPTAGVYPIRLSWWEGGGGANVEFFSVDAAGRRHLVNDRSDPQALKAYSQGRTSARLTSLNPYPGYAGADVRPTIAATFQNDLTQVDASSIRLIVDGQQVTATPTTQGNTVTVSFRPTTPYAFNSTHNGVVFYSIGGTAMSNTFNFTVRGLAIQDLGSGFWIEAEDFDFDRGQTQVAASQMPYAGGAYDGLGAVNNVDYAQGGNEGSNDAYRQGEDPNVPMDSQLGANTLDVQRPGNNEVTANYKIGWAGGDWYNYTRTVPAGTYKLVGAMSHGDASGTADRHVARYGIVTAGKGTENQTVVPIGNYSTPSSGGWGNNTLSVLQLGGRDAVLRIPAGTHTFRVWVDSGDWDWFALVNTTDPVSPVSATVSPANGTFSPNALLATVTDFWRSGSLNQSSVRLTVNGTDVTSSATITPSASGATIRFVPQPGAVNYSLVFSDSAGNSYTNTGNYTSIHNAQNFVIEAEDFNHGGGQTIAAASTMPLQAGLYNGLSAVHDVDYHDDANTPDSNLYRLGETPNVPMNENGGAQADRGTFTLAQNYKLGWIGNNEWYNYTRTFPNQTYNVYAAISHGDAGPTTGRLSIMSSPTAGASTNEVGIFNWPGGTGGWGPNRLVPLTDSRGNLVAVPLNGTQTIRYNAGSGDFDYLIFTPGAARAVAQDVTSPNDVITGFGGNWPGGENPTNAFNNTSLKYLNFGTKATAGSTAAPFQGPVGLTVTPAVGSTVITGARFYTANDAPERDPVDYRIEGSNDGTTWTVISSGPLSLPTTRTPANQNMLNGPRQEVTFANTAAYTSYRITFNNVRNNTTANSMQIGEIELLGVAGGGGPTGPTINIARNGANITLTWAGGGTLEATTNLGPGATWTAVSTSGTFTTTAEGQRRFFRVRQ